MSISSINTPVIEKSVSSEAPQKPCKGDKGVTPEGIKKTAEIGKQKLQGKGESISDTNKKKGVINVEKKQPTQKVPLSNEERWRKDFPPKLFYDEKKSDWEQRTDQSPCVVQ